MPVTLAARKGTNARPIHFVTEGRLQDAGLDGRTLRWAETNGFRGQAGRMLLVPGEKGEAEAALFGRPPDAAGFSPLAAGSLARALPAGQWHCVGATGHPDLTAAAFVLGGYVFTRYGKKPGRDLDIHVPGADVRIAAADAEAVMRVRDLINTPANDMGPQQLEEAVRVLARRHKAKVSVISGDALLRRRFPLIHAVGRAAAQAPRLIDMSWGHKSDPKVTLVGKGVCFDTGGLDIKPSSGMLLMKKDMGGAANVLGLASMIMQRGLRVRLRVLVPAVENAIAGNAFRPGDVIASRKGLTVEIGNTDAEGRLVLADALALADEEEPRLLIDMATLTGAARVALGPDLAPFYTADDQLAEEIRLAGDRLADPVWRMPLWAAYDRKLESKVADLGNVGSDAHAGSVTAALFLQRFVERSAIWAHFDIFGWCPTERPHCPVGGEAQAIRALASVLERRFRRT